MQERLSILFNKFAENKYTWEEYNEFLSLIRASDNDAELKALIDKHFTEYHSAASLYSKSLVDVDGHFIAESNYKFSTSRIGKDSFQNKLIKFSTAVAALVVIIFLVWPFIKKSGDKNQAPLAVLEKSTTKAEKKYIVLSDGTQVYLNAASILSFPEEFKGDKREVVLTGEAFFDVKHAEKKPFVIHSGRVTTTVLGTAFNIKAYPGQTSITVAVSRGKVKVDNGTKTTILIKGQEIKLSNESNKIISKDVEPEKIAAWQQGELVYDDVPLKDILLDLENVYGVQIEITDAVPKQISVTASFKRQLSIEELLNVLSKLINSKVNKTNTGYQLIN